MDLLDPKKIDYREIPLVVAPEAHFFMGGVAIDHCGRASLRGLYAAGENAGGLHGGNRLNSNSIPETQVFGHRAGLTAAREALRTPGRPDPRPIEKVQKLLEQAGSDDSVPPDLSRLGEQLRGVADRELGIVRSGEGLDRALNSVDDILQSVDSVSVFSIRGILARIELSDLCATARACAMSALYRTESRAAHYRDDFQASSPEWRRTILYTADKLSTKAIEPDPDETSWDAARKAAATGRAVAEKEYVE
jgi:fumarate reductase (CoM/CoB) subunit A